MDAEHPISFAVEELLCLPDETTRAFAVQLVFHVAARYPIKETELATNVGLQRMREAVESDSRELLVCHPQNCLVFMSHALQSAMCTYRSVPSF
jgi:hypothetical protein